MGFFLLASSALFYTRTRFFSLLFRSPSGLCVVLLLASVCPRACCVRARVCVVSSVGPSSPTPGRFWRAGVGAHSPHDRIAEGLAFLRCLFFFFSFDALEKRIENATVKRTAWNGGYGGSMG